MLDHPAAGHPLLAARGYQTPDFRKKLPLPGEATDTGSLATGRYLRNVHRLTLPDYPYRVSRSPRSRVFSLHLQLQVEKPGAHLLARLFIA